MAIIPEAEPYLIKLDAFEGPLDLLLFLIKKNEVNIYDIPVARITEQYLEYLEPIREINLETAGDYIQIASELGLIKSRMLLPKPVKPEDEQEEDPRSELVRRLIEYKRYKEASLFLLGFDILGRDVFTNPMMPEEEESSEREQALLRADLMSLVKAFYGIASRSRDAAAEAPVMEFIAEATTVDEKITELIERFRFTQSLSFENLLQPAASRFEIVITFLAALELARTGMVSVLQESPDSGIELLYSGSVENWTREIT